VKFQRPKIPRAKETSAAAEISHPLVPKEYETKGSKDPLEQHGDAIRKVGSMSLGVMHYAVDPEAADRLWNLSEQLLGLEPCERA
jgi:hypothetical protein